MIYTLVIELVGACLLYLQFTASGVDNAVWSSILPSVSAFCTAGFSLNPNSLENFRGDVGVNATISALS
ncbi:potassium transporter TrkG, partial [Escherichia coli]|uniref:potassium transporter TrkG n=1 Tax=Escherichia coli TaxID=562 RepID=UPI0028E00415